MYVTQLRVNGYVNFWMFRAHKSSMGWLVDTVRHVASKIPLSLYTRQAMQGGGKERGMHGPQASGSMKRAPQDDGKTNRKS